RDPGKPILVLVRDLAMASTLVATIPDAARRLAARFWPGPLTLVLPARDGLAPALTAGPGTLGVRVPGPPTAPPPGAGLDAPVTAPSATPPGASAPRRLPEARAYFGDDVAVYLDGGELPGGASTVAAIEGDRARVLRAGPISDAAIAAALGE